MDLKKVHECPECGSMNTFYSKYNSALVCRDCGVVFAEVAKPVKKKVVKKKKLPRKKTVKKKAKKAARKKPKKKKVAKKKKRL